MSARHGQLNACRCRTCAPSPARVSCMSEGRSWSPILASRADLSPLAQYPAPAANLQRLHNGFVSTRASDSCGVSIPGCFPEGKRSGIEIGDLVHISAVSMAGRFPPPRSRCRNLSLRKRAAAAAGRCAAPSRYQSPSSLSNWNRRSGELVYQPYPLRRSGPISPIEYLITPSRSEKMGRSVPIS